MDHLNQLLITKSGQFSATSGAAKPYTLVSLPTVLYTHVPIDLLKAAKGSSDNPAYSTLYYSILPPLAAECAQQRCY